MLVAAVAGINDSQEASLVDEATGIMYSPDLVALQGEFKTTRAETIPRTEEEAKRKFSEYIRQCRLYAALMGTTTYKLIVFYFAVIDKTIDMYVSKKPRLRAYELTFTLPELERERKRAAEMSVALQHALDTDDTSALPLCQSWKCYTSEGGVKIARCLYWDDCKPKGRYTPIESTLGEQ